MFAHSTSFSGVDRIMSYAAVRFFGREPGNQDGVLREGRSLNGGWRPWNYLFIKVKLSPNKQRVIIITRCWFLFCIYINYFRALFGGCAFHKILLSETVEYAIGCKINACALSY